MEELLATLPSSSHRRNQCIGWEKFGGLEYFHTELDDDKSPLILTTGTICCAKKNILTRFRFVDGAVKVEDTYTYSRNCTITQVVEKVGGIPGVVIVQTDDNCVYFNRKKMFTDIPSSATILSSGIIVDGPEPTGQLVLISNLEGRLEVPPKSILQEYRVDGFVPLANLPYLLVRLAATDIMSKTVLLWDSVENVVVNEYESCSVWDKCYRNFAIVRIDNNRLAFGKDGIYIYDQKNHGPIPDIAVPVLRETGSKYHEYTIASMILLRQKFIIYSTSALIGAITIKGEYLWQLSVNALVGDDVRITLMQELSGGSIALQTEYFSRKSVALIREKVDFVTQFESAIDTHCSKNLRFLYEAAKLESLSTKPCFKYLEIVKNSKLRKRIALDVFSLTKISDQNNLEKFTNKFDVKFGSHKRRLFVGEGDFRFTKCLLDKHGELTHPDLGKFITATEFRQPRDADIDTHDRIEDLKAKGVTVLFDVDATQIHELFSGQNFARIHWNFPSGLRVQEINEEFKQAIPKFFDSSSKLQNPADRIHVTLTQPEDKHNSYWQLRQLENPVVLGSTRAGYRLIRKRRFGSARYPGYVHVKSAGRSGKYEEFRGDELYGREFVFEKVDTDKIAFVPGESFSNVDVLRDRSIKDYDALAESSDSDLGKCWFYCSTDEDSSDYYDSD